MTRLFSSYALCRSGHHATTYWIYAHFSGGSIYLNDPYLIKSLPADDPIDLSNHLKTKSQVFVTFPDRPVSDSCVIESEPFEETRILTIRDPFNLFASRVKHANMWRLRSSPHDILPLWKDHAKEFLGITKTIPTKKIFVNYNDWFRSYEYRCSLTKTIGGDKIPKPSVLEYMSAWGFGSSFTFRDYNGRARLMPVLERWKVFLDERESFYLSLFDEEVIDLSRQIFGYKFVNPIVDQLKLNTLNLR